jgi:hypothetical protein
VVARLLTALVAVAIALALPVGQLRWASIERWCCCPDPDSCRCPHDEPPTDSQLGPCHATSDSLVAPALAAFTPPAAIEPIEPARVIERARHAIATPHAPPAPQRPDAPS